jgi:phosphoribosylformylglycinamidine (FGAM) synthase-like amidotransferase family enzyme
MAKPRALHIQNEVTDPCVPFIEALEARGFDVETVHAYGDEQLPDSLSGIDAVVAGGGLVDTHQAGEYRWLAHEISLVAEAIETSTPYIGLCLGAQVLTEAADQPALPAAAAALLAAALPLQWLAYELAIARDTNPDLIRREQAAYREASKIHG